MPEIARRNGKYFAATIAPLRADGGVAGLIQDAPGFQGEHGSARVFMWQAIVDFQDLHLLWRNNFLARLLGHAEFIVTRDLLPGLSVVANFVLDVANLPLAIIPEGDLPNGICSNSPFSQSASITSKSGFSSAVARLGLAAVIALPLGAAPDTLEVLAMASELDDLVFWELRFASKLRKPHMAHNPIKLPTTSNSSFVFEVSFICGGSGWFIARNSLPIAASFLTGTFKLPPSSNMWLRAQPGQWKRNENPGRE